ncbi:ABC transporter permease [Micromonospora sp. WMMD961]|uniref:ABC transporter permease n=1 Tax=Micromonospora sp. WMMD961 TaxID=3016100 RepID=UPI0024175377|nr:ABC transporter permease [Micromonospora sp. WMMD961]MDG4781393.1 ABC transporter permease [Micromonospora sp. WMMD961]
MTTVVVPAWTRRRALALIERNFMIYRRSVTPLLNALVEPILYLLSIGVGVGLLVGTVPGVEVPYVVYVAPAILATTAMNTAFNQTSFGVFTRMKVEKTYEAILPTPLSVTDIAVGEVTSAMINALLTSIGFLTLMAVGGLVTSAWVLLALPASVLIAYAFAAAGLAVTTYLRDFADFQYIQLFMLPMYLFATTFYPLSVYPEAVQPVIRALPLYHSIELVREPALGRLSWDLLIPMAYLVAFGSVAMYVAARRMTRAMLR